MSVNHNDIIQATVGVVHVTQQEPFLGLFCRWCNARWSRKIIMFLEYLPGHNRENLAIHAGGVVSACREWLEAELVEVRAVPRAHGILDHKVELAKGEPGWDIERACRMAKV
jgi:hypothetical protein